MQIPDLLSLNPTITIDEATLKETLEFAFATGKAPSLLEGYLVDSNNLSRGKWDPQCFQDDLFLDDFVRENFRMHFFSIPTPLSYDYLKYLLSTPPTDLEEIQYRQAISEELATSEQQFKDTKKLYLALRELIWSFDTSSFGVRLDLSEFRIGVLKQLKAVIDRMATHFNEAKSPLKKLHSYGKDIQKTAAYKELDDILAYEDHLSKIDIQVRVGATGDLRGFKILKLQENRANQYYMNPISRVWEKTKLFLRGYRFNDCDLVAKLTNDVFTKLQNHITPFVQLLGQIEFYLCGLAFHKNCGSNNLKTCLPTFVNKNKRSALVYENLFNPLLFAQKIKPTPCTIHPSDPLSITLVTGPNSGGKTRLLQGIGLTQLLGQSGLYAPVSNATLPIVNGIFASLREVDTVEDDEGRLGTELKRIHTLFQQSAHGSMVLIDELCSGTNPSEGVEIVSLVLEMLQSLGTTTFITTHFLDYVHQLQDHHHLTALEFLRVQLDGEDLPTYQFVFGVATSSLAKRIAARLGITRDQLSLMIRDKAA